MSRCAQARRILQEELDKLGWTGAELEQRAKGDARKVRIAERLRAEGAMTVKWIAERLQMGSTGYVNHLLYHQRKRKKGRHDNIKN